jgi:hypothetical protein
MKEKALAIDMMYVFQCLRLCVHASPMISLLKAYVVMHEIVC